MSDQRKTICIVHFNTPEVTKAEVMSIRRQCGEGWRIVIFDNSDVEPYLTGCGGTAAYGEHLPDPTEVAVFDNTRSQLVNFEEELRAHPSRDKSHKTCWGRSIFGSVKHSMSVEWLVLNIDTPFILADSDILLKAPINDLWDESVTAAGVIEKEWGYGVERLQPYLCFINAPECRRLGIHYFDPMRTWGLGTGKTERECWYDTGASFLEDIRQTDGATFKRMSTTDMMVHLGGASYARTKNIPEWLHRYRELWNPDYQWDGQKTIISEVKMDNVRAFTQDGRQYHLTAEDGYLLRAKDTGDMVKTANTLRLDRWEVIKDPNAAQPEVSKGKKKVRRSKKG